MGWTVGWRSRREILDYVTSPSHYTNGYELVLRRIVGNNIWCLVRRPDNRTTITLDIIRVFRMKGQPVEWGYKGEAESYAPFEINCPLSLLNAADETTDENASTWRMQVRKYHAERKARPAYSAGQTWRYGNSDYRLITPSLSRSGWIVKAVGAENQFFMNHRQLRDSTIVTKDAACATPEPAVADAINSSAAFSNDSGQCSMDL